ncbi:MAG: methyl-accepting chemotaxis protein [Desulforhopalus sp.]|nr:methyl-accepting chemotaxis protein [Desulforhopalus sp.]
MAKDSFSVRCGTALFSTPESAIGGAVAFLLSLNFLSTGCLLLSQWFPDLQIFLFSLAGLFFILALVVGMASIAVLRHGLGALAGELHSIFSALDEGRVDLSVPAVQLNNPAAKKVYENYSGFLARLRKIIADTRNIGIDIAIDSTKIAGSVTGIARKTSAQKNLSETVFTASNEANNAIREVSESTQYVSGKTTHDLQLAQISYEEMIDVSGKVQQINQSVESFRATVHDLGRSSSHILTIVALINDIAEQTSLLSLNATIEAARAAEHGKGFAVVAEEVRDLAKRIQPATAEITSNINDMITIVKRTQAETDEISEYSKLTGEILDKATENFKNMVTDFEQANEELVKIASAIEELSTNNNEVTSKVEGITSLSQDIANDMQSSEASIKTLNTVTEKMLSMVSAVKTGEGKFDQFINFCHETTTLYTEQLKALKDDGVNIFDTNYKKVPQTNPQKYVSSYSDRFTQKMQALVDARLELTGGAIYCLAIDKNGYLATHHKKFSQPMTGDPQKDLLNSRHQRIFMSNTTEQRRCSHTEPMLMQTYMRDTGQILSDLSMPIFIDGRHWGAMIVGFDARTMFI